MKSSTKIRLIQKPVKTANTREICWLRF